MGRRLVLLLALLALACVPSCASHRERFGVVYDARMPDDALMDVYLPAQDGRRHPGIMIVHGGAWLYGNRDHHDTIARRLSGGGWVTATIEYRLGAAGRYPKAVQDVGCALSHFRAHAAEYDMDPERIALFGYSAGAHLASLVAISADDPAHATDCTTGVPKPPRSMISASGPMDLRGQHNVIVESFLGGTEDEHPERYISGSPITHVRPGLPPFLFVQGSGDMVVSPDDSFRMQDALKKAGNQADFMQVAGGGHLLAAGSGLSDVQWLSAEKTPEAWLAILDFLERTLGAP